MGFLDVTILGHQNLKAKTSSLFDPGTYDTRELWKRVSVAQAISIRVQRKFSELLANKLPNTEAVKLRKILNAVFSSEWWGQREKIARVFSLTRQYLNSGGVLVVKDARAQLLGRELREVLKSVAFFPYIGTDPSTVSPALAPSLLGAMQLKMDITEEMLKGKDLSTHYSELLKCSGEFAKDPAVYLWGAECSRLFDNNALVRDLVVKGMQGKKLDLKGYVGLKKGVKLKVGSAEVEKWAKGQGDPDLDNVDKKTCIFFDFADTKDEWPLLTSHTVFHEVTHKVAHTRDHWYGGAIQGGYLNAVANADSYAFAAVSIAMGEAPLLTSDSVKALGPDRLI